ncbi:hypothetical protein evm_006295 [Chilo suppressalis]|nr:hypothetical protein evm_006295 [Chilo suppressalis]
MTDDSNDVMCIDSTDGYSVQDFEQSASEKPLMTLFQRLIGNDSKENTVLTNVQIIDILKKEFKMDITKMHSLEIEIYLNLMKKFLKDWPLWDEFEVTMQKLKLHTDSETIKNNLDSNHKNLKLYLSRMLEEAKPYINNVIEDTSLKEEKTAEKMDSDIVLEILCTRQQLYQLFFQTPNPDLNNTIFNLQSVPNKITWNSASLQAILNWPGIQIHVNLGSVIFRREIIHNFKHKLVNKKLNFANEEPNELNTALQVKLSSKTVSQFTLNDICKVLDDKIYRVPHEDQTLVELIGNTIKHDFANTQNVNVQCSFRRMMSKYPYVRNLYAEVNSNQPSGSDLYDLQLEETMTPMFYFVVSKFEKGVQKCQSNWLTIECLLCKVVVVQSPIVTSVREHFQTHHQEEPDWRCTKCNKYFPMVYLAENFWYHDCSKPIGEST